MKRILIVDDNATLAYFTARNLQREIKGVEVITATSCQQAMKQSESFPPSLVIADLRLPDGEGRELIRELSQRSACMTAIVTSANVLPKAQEKGIFACVAKPYEIDVLVDLARHALAQEENNNSVPSDRLEPFGPRTQSVAYDPHLVQNRLAGLLAGLRAFQADLAAEADDAAAVRRLANEQIDRLCKITLDVAGIIKENSASSGEE
jgi:DNA-binding NtrC family response regulator